jgi:hypothetical protein
VGDSAMNREHGLQAWPTPTPGSTSVPTRTVVPVLIRVPAVPLMPEGRSFRGVQARPWRSRIGGHRGRVRRRLRREVRLAAYGLVSVVALAWAPQWFLFQGRVPDLNWVAAKRTRGNPAVAAGTRPAVTISIEPETMGPHADAESPVVFPGILLPPDGSEEPAHAGS